jgi:integrase
VLEPVEFEAAHRAAPGWLDERPERDRPPDAIDELNEEDRLRYAAALSMVFYAGPRMGEIRDVPWRNVDFARSMIRIEAGFTRGERSTPKGRRARSTPLVPVLAKRLATLGARSRFVRADDYVFANSLGDRVSEDTLRAVFYAALARAGLAAKRRRSSLIRARVPSRWLRTKRTCLPMRKKGRRPARAYSRTVLAGTFPRRTPTSAAVSSGSSSTRAVDIAKVWFSATRSDPRTRASSKSARRQPVGETASQVSSSPPRRGARSRL